MKLSNKDLVGKHIIIKDLNFSDFMKDDDGNIITYDSFKQAAELCGMYELPNVLILKIEYNHIEDE